MLLTSVWPILLTALNVASAHSTRHHSSPLSHYEYLTSHDFEILPRDPSAADSPSHYLGANRKGGLTHKDAFRLTLNAFDTTFYLHLAPHDHVLHPEAVVVLNGKEEKTLRDRVRVYTGSVFTSTSASETRMVRGRATRNRLLFQSPVNQNQWRSNLNFAGEGDRVVPYDFEADARRGSAWKTGFDDEDYYEDEEKVGSARIVLHSHSHDSVKDLDATTFEGIFTIEHEASTITYTIKSVKSFLRSKHEHDPILPYPSHTEQPTMIIYREDDKRQDPKNSDSYQNGKTSCGSESLSWNVGGEAELILQKLNMKQNFMRANVTSPPYRRLRKRQTQGCPSTPKVLRMGAAADCSYVTTYGGPDAALQQILTDWSITSKLFEKTFNVALSLIRVELRANCNFPDGAASGLKGPGSATLPTSPEPWNRLCTDPTYTINNRLSDFSKWRGERSGDGVGLWHLMTRCSTESTVGISWLNTICQTDAFPQGTSSTIDPIDVSKVATNSGNETNGNSLVSGDVSNDRVVAMAARTGEGSFLLAAQSDEEFVSGTGVSSITRDEWRVVAHEIAHNFGAIHDCQGTTCTSCSSGILSSANCGCCPCGNAANSCDCGGVFLMNPTSDSGPGEFSPCTANTICSKISGDASSCFVDASAPANSSLPAEVKAQQCGNGIKEAGEECDCGSDEECKAGRNPCCNAQCKLKPGSLCSDSNDTCCNGCKPVAAQTVCRPAISVCDVPEVCSGTSGECPADVTVPDGNSCSVDGNNGTLSGMTCASGQCTSRDLQCRSRTLGQSTQECSGYEDSCSPVCATSQNNCVELQGGFLNGTPCGYGGSCRGTCQGSSLLIAALQFMKLNPGLTIGVGVSVFLLFICAIWRCCQRQRRKVAIPE